MTSLVPYGREGMARLKQIMQKFTIFALACLYSVTTAEAAQDRITIGYSSITADMAGVWMAKETGAFAKYGLSVDLVYISSGALVIQALVGGSVQAGLGASNAAVSAILKGRA